MLDLNRPIFQTSLFEGGAAKCLFLPPKLILPPTPKDVREYFPRRVSRRLIKSGDYFELYHFEKPLFCGYPPLRSNIRRLAKPAKPQEALRDDNVRRTRKMLRRLINSNDDLSKFLTLTYADNMEDLSSAFRDFNKFIKRLKYHCQVENLKFICVPEFQKRGAVHFHVLANLPYIEASELHSIWGHGFIRINKIDHITNVGAYVSKYLGKANFDERFFRKKKFVRSTNLNQPVVVDNSDIDEYVAFFVSNNLHLTYESTFDTKWLGEIQYKQYTLYAEQGDYLFNIRL